MTAFNLTHHAARTSYPGCVITARQISARPIQDRIESIRETENGFRQVCDLWLAYPELFEAKSELRELGQLAERITLEARADLPVAIGHSEIWSATIDAERGEVA